MLEACRRLARTNPRPPPAVLVMASASLTLAICSQRMLSPAWEASLAIPPPDGGSTLRAGHQIGGPYSNQDSEKLGNRMSKSEPRTPRQFRDWLEDTFDDLEPLCQYADPDDFDQMEVAQQVEQASRLACRFGAGDLIEPEKPMRTPRDAMAIVGRLLARMNEKWDKPSDLLPVEEVARLFDISPRTVWRRVAAGEIPQAVSIGGLTKWRREEIQATIDLLTPMTR